MKKITLYIISIIIIQSCAITNEPEFIKIDNVQIINLSSNNIIVGSDALFYNSNDLGCKVINTNIDASINDIKVGKVTQKNLIELDAKNEFKIPLVFSFKPQEVFNDGKKSILTNVLNSFINKTITVNYKGTITLNKAGINFDIDIEDSETIQLKQQ